MENPIDALAKMTKRITEEAEKLGLEVFHTSYSPMNPPIVEVVFRLTPAAIETMEEVEARKMNAEFEAMMGASDIDLRPEVNLDGIDLDLFD